MEFCLSYCKNLTTGIRSGPNARYRVWEAFTFTYLLLFIQMTSLLCPELRTTRSVARWLYQASQICCTKYALCGQRQCTNWYCLNTAVSMAVDEYSWMNSGRVTERWAGAEDEWRGPSEAASQWRQTRAVNQTDADSRAHEETSWPADQVSATHLPHSVIEIEIQ